MVRLLKGPPIADRVRRLRAGRSQRMFAKVCHVPQQTISHIEQGNIPSTENVARIAKHNNVSIDFVLTGKS